ncbi:BatD family protein [Lysobacter sp. A3-1-A15]|uniref:BatD family protein n=1 Tax=Novilysobacter viscosus TaxID=3098602 RepID=UPI002ED7A17E
MTALLRPLLAWLLAASALLAMPVHAETRAWLDRDRIGLGETVTLNIETTASGSPDYMPLRAEFQASGHASRREFERVNGRSVTRTLYAVALRPLREGVITVPSLTVGGERTQPLPLTVTQSTARVPARAGDDVFIESEADDQDPYVQQAVGWTVRLYSAVPLISGQIDQPPPEGASLQRVGQDAQYTRSIDGRRYTIVERRFQLIPERSGTLSIPGARFEGRGTGGFFDDFFGARGASLQAEAAPRFLQVRQAPANAPQPWLPLHGLVLRYRTAPQSLKVGEAATLVVEATADGATAAQMPELLLPPIDGVQVFPEPVQADESFDQGRPRVTLTRRFSLVPARPGSVRLDGMGLDWWDVRAGAAREATLPALTLEVAPGAAVAAGSTAGPGPGDTAGAEGGSTDEASSGTGGSGPSWALVALLFAVLWLATLMWALQRQAPSSAQAGNDAVARVPPAVAPGGGRQARVALRRALDTGGFDEVIQSLCALADPPAGDVDALLARLDDPTQRAAVDAMQRARWAGGDGAQARVMARDAFASGPRWKATKVSPAEPLPPLYPRG